MDNAVDMMRLIAGMKALMLMVIMCIDRESIERVHEENSYLGERTR